MFLGVEGFLCVFWYVTFVKKARLETVFLVTVLFFGLIYNVMLTPYMVPDEEKHIDMAYRYSNDVLGYESLGSGRMTRRWSLLPRRRFGITGIFIMACFPKCRMILWWRRK